MSDIKTDDHKQAKDERGQKHQRPPEDHVDPKYARHIDEAIMEKNIRNEKMRPNKFPT